MTLQGHWCDPTSEPVTGEVGLIGVMIRMAIEDAINPRPRFEPNPKMRRHLQREAVEYLRSARFELHCMSVGADPDVIREAIGRRFPKLAL